MRHREVTRRDEAERVKLIFQIGLTAVHIMGFIILFHNSEKVFFCCKKRDMVSLLCIDDILLYLHTDVRISRTKYFQLHV
jgi:hypothetical protein